MQFGINFKIFWDKIGFHRHFLKNFQIDFVRNKRTCETLKKECVLSEILVKEIYIPDCKIGFASFVSIFPIITALDPLLGSGPTFCKLVLTSKIELDFVRLFFGRSPPKQRFGGQPSHFGVSRGPQTPTDDRWRMTDLTLPVASASWRTRWTPWNKTAWTTV